MNIRTHLCRLLGCCPFPQAPHIQTGKRGEDVAAAYLIRIGYRILGRNIRIGRRDEIDIIALDPIDEVIVCCEVKTRTINHPDFRPELDLTPAKKFRMARSAKRYIASIGVDQGYRVDVVCVADDHITAHYKDVMNA